MTISRTQFSQKLYEGSCTKLDFTGGLLTKLYLFEISMCFYYFVQPLSIYVYMETQLISKLKKVLNFVQKKKKKKKKPTSCYLCI